MMGIAACTLESMVQLRTIADPLGEALYFLRMSGTMYSSCEFTAPWGLVVPAFPGSLMFHVVTSGRCWLEVEGSDPRLLYLVTSHSCCRVRDIAWRVSLALWVSGCSMYREMT